MAWIVGNGNDTQWRVWKDGMPTWTDHRSEATQYARREDAEAVHREDEDAWTIQPYTRFFDLSRASPERLKGALRQAEVTLRAIGEPEPLTAPDARMCAYMAKGALRRMAVEIEGVEHGDDV